MTTLMRNGNRRGPLAGTGREPRRSGAEGQQRL